MTRTHAHNTPTDGLYLLRYCLGDLTRATYGQLAGLPLVPLATSTFGKFRTNEDGVQQFFIATALENHLLSKAHTFSHSHTL
jgi:hypothetical protein